MAGLKACTTPSALQGRPKSTIGEPDDSGWPGSPELASARQNIAIGFAGLPVPRGTLSGSTISMNS